MNSNRWKPKTNELAMQVPIKQLDGWLFKHLVVEQGQQVLFSTDGKRMPPQGAGQYTVHDIGDLLMQKLGLRTVERMSAVVFNCNPFRLQFHPDSFFTKDPYRISMHLALSLQVEQVERCHDVLMGGRPMLTTDAIQTFLRDELENIAQEWIGTHKLDQLVADFRHKRAFTDFCEDLLRPTLESAGLAFVQLQSLNYHVLHRTQQNEVAESYLIQVTSAETELDGETKLFELLSKQEQLAIRKETADVALFEQRAQIRQRMRRAVQSEQFEKLETEQQATRYLRQLDRQRLIADDEWDRLKRDMAWRVADEKQERGLTQAVADRRRAQLLARLDIEQKVELQSLTLQAQMQHEPRALAHQLAIARQKLEAEHDSLVARQTFDLTMQRQRTAFKQEQQRQAWRLRREQQTVDALWEREQQLAQAQTKQQIALSETQTWGEREQIRLRIVQIKTEMGMANLERMQAMQRRDEHERRRSLLEAQQIEQEMHLKAQRAAFEQSMAQTQQQQAHELAWIASLKGRPIEELLVAARDPKQADLLHRLGMTQTMKGMSEGQILATLAGDSGEAARALTEIHRAKLNSQLATEQKELYERWLADRSAENSRLQQQQFAQLQDRQAERDSTNRLIDTQLRGIAQIEQAKSASPKTVTQAVWGTTASYSAEPATNTRCPHCHRTNALDATFCGKCGKRIKS